LSRLLIVLMMAAPLWLAGCAMQGNKGTQTGSKEAGTAAKPTTTKPEQEQTTAPAAKTDADVAAANARKAQASLNAGLKAYDNGDYKVAGSRLQGALDLGLASKTDQVTAYKYLAFLACASNQRETCKQHFRRAFAINPRFKLSPTEAGHPVWGPAFKEVVAERAAKGLPTP